MLRLIRYKNLLIVAATQLLCWLCIIRPIATHTEATLLLQPFSFLFLCLSTVFIAAAGYIINDYFDVQTDTVNKPGKMILGRSIPRRLGIVFHIAFNAAALACAGFIAWRGGHWEWLLLQLSCIMLLWFYSTHFKSQFVTGNVVVSLLTALTILTLFLYEPALRTYVSRPAFLPLSGRLSPNPVYAICVYAYFAFVLTWMREIVKDMEDFRGDDEAGCVTMPIKIGLGPSAVVVQILAALALIPLCLAAAKLCSSTGILFWMGVYTIALVIIPIIALAIFLPKKHTISHYHLCSRFLKLIMLSGLLTLVFYVFRYG